MQSQSILLTPISVPPIAPMRVPTKTSASCVLSNAQVTVSRDPVELDPSAKTVQRMHLFPCQVRRYTAAFISPCSKNPQGWLFFLFNVEWKASRARRNSRFEDGAQRRGNANRSAERGESPTSPTVLLSFLFFPFRRA